MDKLYKKKLEKIFNKIDTIASKGRDYFMEYNNYIDEIIEKGDYSAFQDVLYFFYQIDISNAQTVFEIRRFTWKEILFQTKSTFLKKLKLFYDSAQVYQISYDIFTTNPSYVQVTLGQPLSPTYSATAFTQSVAFGRIEDIVNLYILNNDVYRVNIYSTTWATQSGIYQPDDLQIVQRISMTGSLTIKTDIPTTTASEYLITTEQRNAGVTGSYRFSNYRLNVVKESKLGTIKEIEVLTPDYKYLQQNKQYSSILGARTTYLEVQRVVDATASNIYFDNPTLSEEQNLLNRYKIAIAYLNS